MKKIFFLPLLFFVIAFLYNSTTPTQVAPRKASPTTRPSPALIYSVDASTSPSTIETTRARVIRVIDGDTIEIEGKKKVRYIGVDTPETKKPRTPVQCFGQEAYLKNKELVEGHEVLLEKDVSETDRYGRLLRYVYLPKDNKNASGEAIFVNDYLVRQGYAFSSTYPPDVKYQEQFLEAQEEAREASRGLWKSCPTSQ
jgi:micrococcal nuclease